MMKPLSNQVMQVQKSREKILFPIQAIVLRPSVWSRFCRGVSTLSLAVLLAMPMHVMASNTPLSAADPQLRSLFTMALAHNPNIELAQSGVDINGYQIKVSESEEGPTVQLISELSYSWVMEKEFGRTANQLRASYPLYQPDKKAQTHVSQQALEVAKQGVKISQQDILLKIAMQYYAYWQQQAEWEFLGQEKQTYLDLLEQSKNRFQLGFQDLNDLTEIQAKIDGVQAQQIAVKQAMQSLYFELTELVNRPFDINAFTRLDRLPGDLSRLPSASTHQGESQNDQAWSDLIRHNPAIVAVDQQMSLIDKQVIVDQLSDGPQVELFTAYTYNDSDDHFYDDMQGLKGGVQIKVPIYLSGKTDAKVAKTRATRQQLAIKKEILAHKIRRIAQQSRMSFELGLQQLSLQNKAIESNKAAIKAIESGMSTGNRNMMDLLKAYNDLHKTEKTIPILKAKLWQYWWKLQWVNGNLAKTP
jgi:outer membrane protein